MSTISTHVLDTALGRPAAGIAVSLERNGRVIGSGVTDRDGRVRDFAPKLDEGVHRLTFDVAEYFAAAGRDTFYSAVTIEFRVTSGPGSEHYHVPLLLSPYGYSTYRGS